LLYTAVNDLIDFFYARLLALDDLGRPLIPMVQLDTKLAELLQTELSLLLELIVALVIVGLHFVFPFSVLLVDFFQVALE